MLKSRSRFDDHDKLFRRIAVRLGFASRASIERLDGENGKAASAQELVVRGVLCLECAAPGQYHRVIMRFRRGLGAALGAGLVLATASHAFAEPGAGTFDDPIRVDAFPYAIAGTTADVTSERIDSYSCALATDESGPEQLYRFELGASARVTAWVQGDGGSVDIDVHLLTDLALDGSTAASCAARGNVIAEAELAAGEHFVVVDSFEGAAQAGPYVLHLEAIGDAWIERTVADGVRWRARRFTDWAGAQVVHELVVDTSASGVELLALDATGCETVGAMGAAAGAVAGINGGYFDTGGGCPPVSLLKSAGVLIAPNAVTRAPAPANRSGAWAWLALAIAVRRRRARGAGPDGGIETTIRPSEHVMLDVSVPKLLDEAP